MERWAWPYTYNLLGLRVAVTMTTPLHAAPGGWLVADLWADASSQLPHPQSRSQIVSRGGRLRAMTEVYTAQCTGMTSKLQGGIQRNTVRSVQSLNKSRFQQKRKKHLNGHLVVSLNDSERPKVNVWSPAQGD